MGSTSEADNKAKQAIIDKYVKLLNKKGSHPSRGDMIKAGVSRDKIRHHFGSHVALRAEAKKSRPEAFEHIIDESLFTRKAFKKLKSDVSKFKRYFVTTAVAGCEADPDFITSIQTYCKEQNAMPLILPASDPAASVGWALDSKFSENKFHIVFDDLPLNDNVFLSCIKLSAKHINPTTGLARIGQRNGSFVYASPKQYLKMTPTSNIKLPHAMMTTGAVTKADYATTRYLSERTAYIAQNDHVLGGIIVEIQDDKIFHFRQIQADRQGQFVDLGIAYSGETSETVRPTALVLGDWHSGETDPEARRCFVDGPDSVLAVTKPRMLIIHDGFNGRSISHHEIKNMVLRAQRAAKNELDLQAELTLFADDLNSLASKPGIEKIVIVKSNHDEFLCRYLAEGRYVEDAQNHLIGLKLAAEAVSGCNPLKAAVEWLGLKNPEKFIWLERDEDFKIANIELGAHGDKGANGAKGSLQAMENAYGNSVSGHSHTPQILRGAWQVGTCSLLKLAYNSGPSSWLHTSALVYPNGARQLINVINGQWRLVE